jgi:branched-chain amino acid transport system ATP-binding protein/urea transport system ATP-binding protein
MTSPSPILQTDHLTRRFGGVVAVDDVSLVIQEGELRCLIGPNGAGKSTFFKMLTGQLVPSSGSIRYRGRAIAGILPHEIAQLGIGIKTQVPNLFDGLSVAEHLWLAARRKNGPARAQQLVESVLDETRLGGLSNAIVGQLAHGLRQRVEIATVLAAEPDLILLDEPVAGMTEQEVRQTAELIKTINARRTIVVVEHDIGFIRLIATRVTVFHQGAVLVEDAMERVLEDQRVRNVYLGNRR